MLVDDIITLYYLPERLGGEKGIRVPGL